MRSSNLLFSTLAALTLSSAAHADQLLGQGRIDSANRVVLPGGPTLGRYQSGRYIATPDALQLQGFGSTGDVSTMSVLPNAGAPANTLASLIAGKQPIASILTGLASGRAALSSPDWNNYTKPYLPLHVNVGGYPDTALAGGTTVGTTHSITGSVTIPETTRNNNLAVFAAGVAGYARSLNSTSPFQQAVGLYGAGLCGVGASSCWGSNLIVANIPDLSEPQANRGVHNMSVWGLEIDMNIQRLSNGNAPGGNGLGLDLVGNSASQPLGHFRGINVQAPGLYAGVGWKEGIFFDVGATDNGIVFNTASVKQGFALTMNPTAASGASGSQSFQFITRKPDGSASAAFLRTEPAGGFLFTPGSGANVSLTKSDLSTSLSAGDAGVFINIDGSAKRVSVGAADSCGAGFKCLRVPN